MYKIVYYDHYETTSMNPIEDDKTILVSYGRYLDEDDRYIYLIYDEVWEGDKLVSQKVNAILKCAIIEVVEFEHISHSRE